MNRRSLKRALQGWQQEFSAFWGRLTAFHRMVIGMVIALVLVGYGQKKMLNPLEQKVQTIRDRQMENALLSQVPAPAEDDQTQVMRLRAQGLAAQLIKTQQQVRAAEDESEWHLDATATDANAWLVACATRCGVRVCENREADGTDSMRTFYKMSGRFEAVYQLLQRIDQAPFFCVIEEMALQLDGLAAKKIDELIDAPSLLNIHFTLQFKPYTRELK